MKLFGTTLMSLGVSLCLSLFLSTHAFAGQKDLAIFNTLVKVGVIADPGMSQLHVGVNNVECAYSNHSHEFECNLWDISANDGEGTPRALDGRSAKAVFKMLVRVQAPTDSGMGKTFISAKTIRCQQSVEGVADGSAADRTSCSVEL
jgi:hypothetical protein